MQNILSFCGTMLFVLFSVAISPAVAQEANCADPQSTLEMKICASRSLEVADSDLNANYQKARNAMRETDQTLKGTNLAGAEKALRDAQRVWIKYRDAACDAEGFTARGGTLEGLIVLSCRERMTRQRSEDLQHLSEF